MRIRATVSDALDSTRPAPREAPLRTCIGCRARAGKSELLRVTARDGQLIIDGLPASRSRQPGRGAYLHPTAACLDRAQRRRAFARALRVPGPLDITALREWIEAADDKTATDG
ncbi:YlxR family protein [Escherichia coli]|uniref:YlxR family protein n=1 Tax=Escherichia coli TaxID=562 RepID=UPI003CCA1BA5